MSAQPCQTQQKWLKDDVCNGSIVFGKNGGHVCLVSFSGVDGAGQPDVIGLKCEQEVRKWD